MRVHAWVRAQERLCVLFVRMCACALCVGARNECAVVLEEKSNITRKKRLNTPLP